MKINSHTASDCLPLVIKMLPDGYTAWASKGKVYIYEGDVEIAQIDVAGMTPEESAEKVEKELTGVI